MKVFVATPSSDDRSDFAFTVPGELVHLPPASCACPDCGCDQAMAGFSSHKSTTTFVVRDLPLELDTYAHLLFESLAAGGWVDHASGQDLLWTREWATAHADLAAGLPEETPLQLDGGHIKVRSPH